MADLDEIHRDALRGLDDAYAAESDQRQAALSDRLFARVAAKQWDNVEDWDDKTQVTINRVHRAVLDGIREYRAHRVGINFLSRDGVDRDGLADVCDKLLRADLARSVATEADDTVFRESYTGGYGAMKIRADYVDDGDINNDRQALLFEPIHDADHRVFFNVGALRQDKADATECWVITPMPRKQYEAEHGRYEAGFNTPRATAYTWATQQIVNVCEYYTVTNKRQKTELYRTLTGDESRHFTADLNAGERERLEAGGAVHVEGRDRMIKRRQVRKYVLNGRRVLKDCGVIPGEYIPVVMCLMDRDVIDGREYCQGVVRDGRDPQVVKNVLTSALLDDAGQGLREQPIIDPAQIPTSYMAHWSRANRGKYAFLPMSAPRDAEGNIVAGPSVQYTKPMSVPPLVAALLQSSDVDLDAMLGSKKAEDTEAQYHQSGIALELVNERGDEHHAIYMQDFTVFKAHQARVWLSMASEIYVEDERVMRGVDKNGKADQVTINRPVKNDKTDAIEYEADMANARFDVVADLGPSAVTRRDATARRLTAMAAAPGMSPDDAAVLTAAAVQHIDLDNGAEVKEHFRRRLVRMGAAAPTEEDKERAAAVANAPPTAEEQYYQSAAANEKAKAVETLATVEKTEAQTDKLRAETYEIINSPDD